MSLPSKKLHAEWNKKLKDSGFIDAEDTSGQLKAYHGSRLFSRSLPNVDMASKEEYYRIAAQFLYEYKDFTDITRLIWELHSQGHTIRDIANSIPHPKKSQVYKIIHKLAKIMLATYQEEQNND